MSLDGILGVIGAVTGTIAIGWNFVRDLKDSGKLRIDAIVGKLHPNPTGKNYLAVTITNVGRRPVLVKGMFTLRKGSWHRDFLKFRVVKYRSVFPYSVLVLKQGPKMLKEGEEQTELFEDFSFVDEKLAAIGAIDSGGREWKLKGKRLRFVVREALREAKESV